MSFGENVPDGPLEPPLEETVNWLHEEYIQFAIAQGVAIAGERCPCVECREER